MVACVLLMAGCCNTVYTVTVTNPTGFDRHPEMVELCMSDVASALSLAENDTFVVKDENDNEVPYQVTSDEKLIFQVQMKASSKAYYRICKGRPAVYETLVFGKQFPERLDDFVWENDLVGFRAYGPALQAKGERGFGYDLFTKRGTRQPVLADFYELAVGERTRKRYNELHAEDPQKAADYKLDTMTLHVDHGYGMDVYAVGPTLGAGVTALMDEEGMIFPWCYKEYEIIENGPLRFSFKLTFNPVKVGADENVVEARVITLDAGSYLNHTSVSYSNLTCDRELAAGIVLRDKDGKETAELSKGYIAYPAPSMNFDPRNLNPDNGTHFVGHVYPEAMKEAKTVYYSDQESQELRGGAAGHILAFDDYHPGDQFDYYWGFGWDHSEMKTYQQWISYLETFSQMVNNPLVVTVE